MPRRFVRHADWIALRDARRAAGVAPCALATFVAPKPVAAQSAATFLSTSRVHSCAAFSAAVMREIRSRTRAGIGAAASL